MNLYISVEVLVRELDSKLLLAVIAASRGHEVIVSDNESIIKGLERKLLKPGLYLTKSLVPSKAKLKRHKKIIELGCKISSIDEEGGLVDYGYDQMIRLRYDTQTIAQASAVFTWGKEDFIALKKSFPKYSKKFYMTGSPRSDLWTTKFSSYWKKDFIKFNKPYLLIPSNFGAGLAHLSFYERMMIRKKRGYFEKEYGYVKMAMKRESELFKFISYFIEAIEHLSKNKKYHVVLRPHPAENEKIWKILLSNISNVSVIKKDGISHWVENSFAILHNGCTTALEASISQKPVITYSPFKASYDRKLANDLGEKVTNLSNLLKKVDSIFLRYIKKNKFNKPLPKILTNKIFIDKKETAAEKIVNVWEKLSDHRHSKKNNWFLYKSGLKIMKLNKFRGEIFKKNHKTEENFKFPPFEKKKIDYKIKELVKIMGINKKISCTLFSDRTILIKQNN